VLLNGFFLVTVGSCCLQYSFPRVFVTVLFVVFVSTIKDGHFRRKSRGANIYYVVSCLSIVLA
jgi:hypothetical protein